MSHSTKAPGQQRTNWVNGLDSIRFVLALIVFLSHLANPYHAVLSSSPHFILKLAGMLWGVLFSGVGSVMAFFIISGFVIHYPNKDKYPETKSFLIRRWLRIGMPLLVIAIVAGFFHIFSEIPIWSLYCELIYYTLYPVLIRIKADWKTKFGVSFVVATVFILLFAPDDWQSLLHQRNINYNGAYWQLGGWLTWVIGLPCWLLGVLLAQNIEAVSKEVSAANIYWSRLLVLITGILLDVLKFHFFLSYFFSMNFFAVLLFFWIRKEILYYRSRKPVGFLESMGKFSYSLYLCHNVFVFFLIKFIPLNTSTYFLIIALTLLSSYLFYVLVEKPSHLLSRKAAKWIKKEPSVIKKLAVNEN